jgi:hypothetical protein
MRSIRLLAVLSILVGSCLAGCGHASPAGTSAQLGVAAINGGTAEDVVDAARSDFRSSAFWRLGGDVKQLSELPSTGLGAISSERNSELNQLEVLLLGRWADNWTAYRQYRLPQMAAAVVDYVTVRMPENYEEALNDVTEDAIRGMACREVYDLAITAVSPQSAVLNPQPANDQYTEAWPGNILSSDDIISDAKTIIGGTISPYIGLYMNWVSWYNEVTQFAGQVSATISSNPPAYVNILSNPEGQRAAYVYARYCYAPPGSNGSQ